MEIYIQKKDVSFLSTPKGTVWALTPKSILNDKNNHIPFINPINKRLRTTLFGLRYDKHKDLFHKVDLGK